MHWIGNLTVRISETGSFKLTFEISKNQNSPVTESPKVLSLAFIRQFFLFPVHAAASRARWDCITCSSSGQSPQYVWDEPCRCSLLFISAAHHCSRLKLSSLRWHQRKSIPTRYDSSRLSPFLYGRPLSMWKGTPHSAQNV
jgi:hypothetical protein